MGNKSSLFGLSEELLEDYETLTYLRKNEILHLMKKFRSIDPYAVDRDINHRFHKTAIMEKFPNLKYNPFQDRLFKLFSSKKDDCFSFEDILDLCSVMSENCPDDVKASWAFRVYDFNDDMQIGKSDICNIIDRLVWDYEDPMKSISLDDKNRIAKMLVEEMSLSNSAGIGASEFRHCMSKMTDFPSSFYFRP